MRHWSLFSSMQLIGQHWFRQWVLVPKRQAITWSNENTIACLQTILWTWQAEMVDRKLKLIHWCLYKCRHKLMGMQMGQIMVCLHFLVHKWTFESVNLIMLVTRFSMMIKWFSYSITKVWQSEELPIIIAVLATQGAFHAMEYDWSMFALYGVNWVEETELYGCILHYSSKLTNFILKLWYGWVE